MTNDEFLKILQFYHTLNEVMMPSTSQILHKEGLKSVFPGTPKGERGLNLPDSVELSEVKQLLLLLLESELNRYAAWISPLLAGTHPNLPEPVNERNVAGIFM